MICCNSHFATAKSPSANAMRESTSKIQINRRQSRPLTCGSITLSTAFYAQAILATKTTASHERNLTTGWESGYGNTIGTIPVLSLNKGAATAAAAALKVLRASSASINACHENKRQKSTS